MRDVFTAEFFDWRKRERDMQAKTLYQFFSRRNVYGQSAPDGVLTAHAK